MQFGLTAIVRKELMARKGRLLSGLLVITVGIAVVVCIQSIASVSQQMVAQKLDLLGANIMVLPQGASVDNYYSADIDAPTFPESYVERISSSMLPGVDNLSPKLSRRLTFKGQSIVLTGILPANEIAAKPIWQSSTLMGAELATTCGSSGNKASTLPAEVLRAKRKKIDKLGKDELWVGSTIAKTNKLQPGNTLRLLGHKFTISHILPETGTIDDDRMFAHLHSVQKLLGIGSQINSIEIMGCCSEISKGLLGKLRNILPDTRIITIGQVVKTQIDTNNLMEKVALILLFIVIFVGALSMGNYMWANVEERRREIGVFLTVGMKRRHIYSMFFAKAFVLGILGGLAGYIFGALSAWFIGFELANYHVYPIPSYLGFSILAAICISVLGSWYPIWRGAGMDPAYIMKEV